MKAKMRISASTVEGLEKALNDYFYSQHYRVNLDTMKVENPRLKSEALNRWEVRIKKGRYYIFELFKS